MDYELLLLLAEKVLGPDALRTYLKQKENENARNTGDGADNRDSKPGSGNSKPGSK